MKPVSLKMEAFGPYATVSEVDFEPLADVGLFVVSGPTGAGKSTIFDAICFALYGSLSGARQGHIDVRSHYADATAECSVQFVFDAEGERWRVTRQPAQLRQKRRGVGTTERPADAVLERWVGGGWQPDAAKVRDVTIRCRELVGLSLDQFERVVLLPQGKFAEVLNARTADRADLLRTLFGSEVFERVGEILAEEAKLGERNLDGAADQRGRFHRRAVESLDRVDADLGQLPDEVTAAIASERSAAVEAASHLPDPTANNVTAQLSLLDALPADLDQADTAVADGANDDPVDRLRTLRSGALVTLEAVVDRLRLSASGARSNLERAEAQAKAIGQRRAAAVELGQLLDQRQEMEALSGRLTAARSVADLSAAVAHRSTTDATVSEARQAIATGWARACALLDPLVGFGARSPESAPEPEVLAELLDQAAARATAVEALMAKADKLERQRTEHGLIASQREALEAQLVELDEQRTIGAAEDRALELEAGSLEAVVAERPALVLKCQAASARVVARRRVDALVAQIAQLDTQRGEQASAGAAAQSAIEQAQAEITILDALIADRAVRQSAVDTATKRLAVRTDIGRLSSQLATLDRDATARQIEADQIFASFVHGTAPRLAAELSGGEPCPVCGSCEHPAPAHHDTDNAGGERIVDVAAVEAASSTASAAQVRKSECQTSLAALMADDPGLADIESADLQVAVDIAARALDAVDEAERTRSTFAAGVAELECRLVEIRASAAATEVDAAAAQASLNGALAELDPDQEHAIDVLTIDLLLEQEAELQAQRATAEAAHQRSGEIATRRVAIASSLGQLEVERGAVAVDRATTSERLEQLGASIRRGEERLNQSSDASDLVSVRGRLEELRSTLIGLQRSVNELAASEASLAAAASRCASLVTDAGFESEAAALAASMSRDEVATGEARHSQWVHRSTSLSATVEVLDAQGLPEHMPDIESLRSVAIGADADLRVVSEISTSIGQHLHQASLDLDEVAAIDAATADDRARHDVVRRVASVVRGNNSRRLSLENWVLSVYLHDVVDHANLHLHTMSNGRYRLLVQDAPSNQVGQHGLDLAVDDAHTGRVRPSVSLSGGETFQASLALALGLADVVMVGRAGLHLDALFVDEGFGSLDAEAIDQAITVLDGLRSRGSMVGVITHVEALKTALPVAIEVRPRSDHRGSEIRQVA